MSIDAKRPRLIPYYNGEDRCGTYGRADDARNPKGFAAICDANYIEHRDTGTANILDLELTTKPAYVRAYLGLKKGMGKW